MEPHSKQSRTNRSREKINTGNGTYGSMWIRICTGSAVLTLCTFHIGLPELSFPFPWRGYGLVLLLDNHHVELSL